jgi:choline kinase
MAGLTAVPVTLSLGKVPTKRDVRDIIGTFLPEWRSVEPDTLTMSYHASFINAHCPVERPSVDTDTPAVPSKVFIKFHNETEGDPEVFKHLVPTKQEEAILTYELGQSGRGAKVYGFFQTQDGTLGRVDEFLEARNMEPEDVENAIIRADVAKALATLHTLKPPLEKKEPGPPCEAIMNGLKKYHKMDKLKTLGKEGGVSMDELVDYDFGTRLGMILNKLGSMEGKTGWCMHDIQFMNVMVASHPKEEESKVALIDLEYTIPNYRALDIGGHFMQKMFKWFDEESKIANCRKYTEEEKRHFCEEYAMHWNRLTGDADTGAQVFLESEYGYMLAIAFDIHMMLWFMSENNDTDHLNLLGLNKLFDEFVDQYAKLGMGNQ